MKKGTTSEKHELFQKFQTFFKKHELNFGILNILEKVNNFLNSEHNLKFGTFFEFFWNYEKETEKEKEKIKWK